MAPNSRSAVDRPPRHGYFADLLSTVFDRRLVSLRSTDTRPIGELCAALMSATGEGASLDLSISILQAYGRLDDAGKRAFFALLADDYDIDPAAVAAHAATYADEPSSGNLDALLTEAEPRRQALFRKLNQVDGATAALVSMRRDVLTLSKEVPAFGRIDLDLRHLFASWFNRGFLVLRRINWQTPANVLEKIIAYEAVHAINDWNDLRRRVQPADRRCFAYFHPCMPDDPLIFVEVALTSGTPTSIATVLAEDRQPLDPARIDTAVFYSISNCQRGLAGISFGNALIKQVVADLAVEMPQLSTFVTLSPVPGLARWLTAEGEASEDARQLLAAAQEAGDPAPLIALDDAMSEAAADYLLNQKDEGGAPLDPVARFHLANGAQLAAIHPRADLSRNGRESGCGVMVNYLYQPKKVADRAEKYAQTLKVDAARPVETLLRNRQRRLNQRRS